MTKGLEITRSPTGITFTVRNPNGQVAWFKFVAWWKYEKNQAWYDTKAIDEEKAALAKEGP